jgi:hypothetical protein
MAMQNSDYDEAVSKTDFLENKYASILHLRYGFEVNQGWLCILEEFFSMAIVFEGWFKVVQIKEKFGSLRIYVDTEEGFSKEDDMLLQGLISEAEFKANRTCCDCGAGNLVSGGRRRFYSVVCEECYEKVQQRRPSKS